MEKFNMQPKKHPMPVQEPSVRNKNFSEVALGYDEQTAIAEAKRCLHCKNAPCVAGCPVKISIPEFIACVAAGEFEKAYEIISRSSSLPAVCGRVCPQETQCEGQCTRGKKEGAEAVGIGYLERFVADYHYAHLEERGGLENTCNECGACAESSERGEERTEKTEEKRQKVAVVGSGPAGLACAGDLAKAGYSVTIFEALHAAGGVLSYGIPEFRLPKKVVKREIDRLASCGVEIQTNVVVGKTIYIEELLDEYAFDAVFIGTGAGLPRFMNIEGEGLKGVYSANEFLTRANLMNAVLKNSSTPLREMKKVVVVGGGNVAMDAARTAKRTGADVTIVYRRGEEELPARKEEVLHAKEEGVVFETLANPVRLIAVSKDKSHPEYGCVKGAECVRMRLGEPDESGRRSPVEIEGSEFFIEADCVIMALGTSPNPLLKNSVAGLATAKRGEIVTDENGKTSLEGVYCGGDAATGAATVIKAMGAGKKAAKAIDEYLQSKR